MHVDDMANRALHLRRHAQETPDRVMTSCCTLFFWDARFRIFSSTVPLQMSRYTVTGRV